MKVKETENDNNINNENNNNINNIKDFEIIEEFPSSNNIIKVYKVLRKKDNNYYILLKYPLDIITKTLNDFKKLENILEKIKILLTKINHKNILNIKESFIEKSNKTMIIILELYENKTFQKNILAKYKLMRERYIPENILLDYLYNIAEGVNILHENNLFNIDLNPINIIIDSNNELKLNPYISLDNLRSINSSNNNNYFKVRAPELLKNKNNYSKESDVWYFGLLIYEISQLKPINKFYCSNIDNIYNYIIKGQYTLNSYYSKDIKELIKLCLQYSPKRRPTFSQIIKIIDLYKKNKALNDKMTKLKLDNKKRKFYRKINLKTEIDKFNKALAKLKNYENRSSQYNIKLNQTPTQLRKNNSHFNINININNRTFNRINLSTNSSNKNISNSKYQQKKYIIDKKSKINLNITGKKFYKLSNDSNKIKTDIVTNNSFSKIRRYKTQNKLQRNLMVKISDNNVQNMKEKCYNKVRRKSDYKNSITKVNNTAYNLRTNYSKNKINLENKKRNFYNNNIKTKNLSNSFYLPKIKHNK